MTTQADPAELIGARVVGAGGEDVGAIEQVYQEDRSGKAAWARVRTGLFGMKDRFVPLAGAQRGEREVEVAFSKQQIKDAPDIDADQHLSSEQVGELLRHYQLTGTGTQADTGTGAPAGQRPRPGPGQRPRPGAGAGQDGPGDGWVTRAEERARVSTESRESGRVTVHKYVDTEPVEQQVRLGHEEAVIEREPVTGSGLGSGTQIGEDEREIILHEERPVISKETVPVERVRIRAERREEDQTVRSEVRKERIEVERDDDTTGGGPS
jgi:stress response protein YsnF